MKIEALKIPSVMVFTPKVFEDERGCFFESYNQKKFFEAIGKETSFVQDNHSVSCNGVLRGLHYQRSPHQQAKLVRVAFGEILDVAVDIRKGSSTFGSWVSQILSAENRKQMWVPEGFAHGFFVRSQKAEVLYKTTDFYHSECEHTILWSDPQINIDWQISKKEIEIGKPIISEKDALGNILESV